MHVEDSARESERFQCRPFVRLAVDTGALHSVGGEEQIVGHGFSAPLFDLAHLNRPEGLRIGHRAMVHVKFPECARNANGLADALELQTIGALVELDLAGGGDQIVPAEVVGCDERSRIGEISARQSGDGLLPGRRGGGRRKAGEARAQPDRDNPLETHRATIRCRLATCKWLQPGSAPRHCRGCASALQGSATPATRAQKKAHVGGVRFSLKLIRPLGLRLGGGSGGRFRRRFVQLRDDGIGKIHLGLGKHEHRDAVQAHA